MNTNQSETPATTLIMDVLDENGDIEMNSINVEAVDAVDLPKLTKETDIRKEVIQSLVYKVSDRPPIHLAIFFALQQALLSLSGSLAISLLVADVVCAANDEDVKSRLLSSTLFMNGVTTLAMVVIGVRLPLYLGAAGDYIIPLLVLVNIQKDRCNLQGEQQSANPMNMTDQNNASNGAIIVDAERASTEMILNYIRMLEGSLILAGVIQFFIGVTGLTGLLLRYLGPVTIFTAMLLNGIYIVKACLKFIQAQWGIALLTCGVAVILSVYLEHKKTPLPFWTRDKGLHIKFYPFHQVFAILIAITVGWLVCALLTYFNVFSPSKDALDYLARTDARSQIIHDAKWFSVPYPGCQPICVCFRRNNLHPFWHYWEVLGCLHYYTIPCSGRCSDNNVWNVQWCSVVQSPDAFFKVQQKSRYPWHFTFYGTGCSTLCRDKSELDRHRC
ncbi:hypothetical protein CHS0354_006356 [Potamilus streckersoni]|uniref:Uncharacterized protein n=1 Tax=Potamilus streckersoni TaxID=2493646 RepID=A0AAE0W334_9BIVA|nr:hypothetical protein CHS0354_006356 [Potamilus streckersoni]